MMNAENCAEVRKKWALVDDNTAILDLYSMLLPSLTPCEIHCFENPLDALAAIRAEPQAFEMIVTDWDMPHLDGVSLLAHVRAAAHGLRFIVVTGNPVGLEDTLDSHELPHSFLAKPFSPAHFCQAIKAAPALRKRNGFIPVKQPFIDVPSLQYA